jgi:AcrR family transcriptional regulator
VTGLRERKKQEARERLATLATMLFAERGFDNVTVADVAEAAGVSKMTVFNYFPRKEDLFFDRAPEFAELLTTTIRARGPEVGPVAAFREMVLRLLDEHSPLAGFSNQIPPFWKVILDSPTLRARAREAVEETEGLLATLIAETGADEAQARLTAALLMAAWRTAYLCGARRIMAGERTADFFAEQRAWTATCFAAVPEPPPPSPPEARVR